MVTLKVGDVVEFDYPAANYHGVRVRLEHRRLKVERIRDLTEEPLDGLTPLLNPQLRRGRLLAVGLDLDKGVERSFYIDSMQGPKLCEPDSIVVTKPGSKNIDSMQGIKPHVLPSGPVPTGPAAAGGQFAIGLLTRDGPTLEHQTDDAAEAAAWVEEWLADHLQIPVAVYPPGAHPAPPPPSDCPPSPSDRPSA